MPVFPPHPSPVTSRAPRHRLLRGLVIGMPVGPVLNLATEILLLGQGLGALLGA